jgi:uncharacterized Zn finger protein
MARYERYRVWTKDNRYETVVATNRHQAVKMAICKKGVPRDEIKAVGKATQHGRLFKVGTA